MTIELSEDLRRFLRAEILSGRFESESAAISEAVRLLQERTRDAGRPSNRDTGPGPTDRAREQHEELQRLCRRLDLLPTTAADDGLTNRDHDRILYGEVR